ncbi:MAG: class I SAM-dependent methyltransferase [Anaerolineaceae bacterium]|nr:class I SAM-dependent methyltransferase [Anaerolineaceae bacterium]
MTEPHSDSPRYDSTRQAWETIWDGASMEVELQAVRYPRSMATIQAYLPYLSKEDIILEAGSGLSAVIITLREMGYTVTGLDYAENALHTSRHYDPALALAVGDVHALPYASDSVGAYLSFGVLEHFEHGMGPALAEAYRVVKPGGVLVLTIPYPNVVQRFIRWRRRGQSSTLNDEDFYESTYTRDILCQAVTDAGFTVEKAIPTSHAFTLWGLGGPFRGTGYYQTSPLANALGGILNVILPWAFNFSTLVIGRK